MDRMDRARSERNDAWQAFVDWNAAHDKALYEMTRLVVDIPFDDHLACGGGRTPNQMRRSERAAEHSSEWLKRNATWLRGPESR